MTDITMPRLSDTMEEGVISHWHKQVGDEVHKGDTLADIETDKTTMELEAYDAGILERLLVSEGDTMSVGEPIAVVGDGSGVDDGSEDQDDEGAGDEDERTADTPDDEPADGDEDERTADTPDEEPVPDGDEEERTADAESEEPARTSDETRPDVDEARSDSDEVESDEETAGPASDDAEPTGTEDASSPPDDGGQPLFRSPLARKLARENDIELRSLDGSGPGGRIVRADVEKALEAGAGADVGDDRARGGASSPAPAAVPEPATAGEADDEVRINANQRITAERLSQMAGVPTFHLSTTIDADALLAFRREVNDRLEEVGTRISVTDLLVRAAAVALRSHPEVNSAWGGDKIIRRGRVHIGLAVALEAGLIVPVVRDADRKSVGQIAAESGDLATRAREGKLEPHEYQGSTFSISNLGMFSIGEFDAIINPPEAAILAVGAAGEEPVLRDGELHSRTVMTLTLTVDHRVLNGAVAAAFLQELQAVLEEPLRIVV
ncbi:hypothetical protein BH708_06015 [Brachybacterium sp. P6-10-X1]|uniref:dihydrolipoamide acetyltransferase family protein n=1 Tax=Brachybacterium sp. P6-10-X1 TaxID=1903186 RepID=UPI000971ADA5|nr:dihydrolipoamide acetyltransferase family protein [Brachybacterium sp. P6-10-X1]APX32349.1 hypothetical protein BH708_06015 [Brachybacterium sp. P6-10-X1]